RGDGGRCGYGRWLRRTLARSEKISNSFLTSLLALFAVMTPMTPAMMASRTVAPTAATTLQSRTVSASSMSDHLSQMMGHFWSRDSSRGPEHMYPPHFLVASGFDVTCRMGP